MWLPTFLKRGIHFLGERTKVLGLNNSVFLDRFHLPIIGNRAGIVNSHESFDNGLVRFYSEHTPIVVIRSPLL